MNWVFEKLILEGAMLQNIISFYFWNQELYLETKNYFDQIWEKPDNFNPLYF